MLHKIVFGAAGLVVLLPQLSYAVGGADVADPMRRTTASFATNAIERCQNISGSQWWFVDPNCKAAAEYAAQEYAPTTPPSAAPHRTWHRNHRPAPAQ
jgi:hypothetical protein